MPREHAASGEHGSEAAAHRREGRPVKRLACPNVWTGRQSRSPAAARASSELASGRARSGAARSASSSRRARLCERSAERAITRPTLSTASQTKRDPQRGEVSPEASATIVDGWRRATSSTARSRRASARRRWPEACGTRETLVPPGDGPGVPARTWTYGPFAAHRAPRSPGKMGRWTGGRSVVVAQKPSKLLGRVRFPSPACPAPRGVAQSGSAPGWGPGGRRFKSVSPITRTAGKWVCFGACYAREKCATGCSAEHDRGRPRLVGSRRSRLASRAGVWRLLAGASHRPWQSSSDTHRAKQPRTLVFPVTSPAGSGCA